MHQRNHRPTQIVAGTGWLDILGGYQLNAEGNVEDVTTSIFVGDGERLHAFALAVLRAVAHPHQPVDIMPKETP